MPKVITAYNNKNTPPQDEYIFVYAADISVDHPPVLDWQSGLENLKQKHTAPVEQKEITPFDERTDDEDQCGCMMVVEIEQTDKDEINNIHDVLKKLNLNDFSDFLERFLETKDINYLDQAVERTAKIDPVSSYKLRKIAKKLKGSVTKS